MPGWVSPEEIYAEFTWEPPDPNAVEGITNLRETCMACPCQFEGDIEGKWLYFRYRHGWMVIEIWDDPDYEGENLFEIEEQIGDSLDGYMERGEVFRHLRNFVAALRTHGKDCGLALDR